MANVSISDSAARSASLTALEEVCSHFERLAGTTGVFRWRVSDVGDRVLLPAPDAVIPDGAPHRRATGRLHRRPPSENTSACRTCSSDDCAFPGRGFYGALDRFEPGHGGVSRYRWEFQTIGD